MHIKENLHKESGKSNNKIKLVNHKAAVTVDSIDAYSANKLLVKTYECNSQTFILLVNILIS